MRGMQNKGGKARNGWKCQEPEWKYKKCGESGWRCRESKWNFGIAVEMTWNCNGNDKFKERREVKIIENEHICNKFRTFDLVFFLLTMDISHTMSFYFYCWFWTSKYRLGRWNKMEDQCGFQINSFTSFFFWVLSIQRCFFSIFQFIGDTTLFVSYKRKKQFLR